MLKNHVRLALLTVPEMPKDVPEKKEAVAYIKLSEEEKRAMKGPREVMKSVLFYMQRLLS